MQSLATKKPVSRATTLVKIHWNAPSCAQGHVVSNSNLFNGLQAQNLDLESTTGRPVPKHSALGGGGGHFEIIPTIYTRVVALTLTQGRLVASPETWIDPQCVTHLSNELLKAGGISVLIKDVRGKKLLTFRIFLNFYRNEISLSVFEKPKKNWGSPCYFCS